MSITLNDFILMNKMAYLYSQLENWSCIKAFLFKIFSEWNTFCFILLNTQLLFPFIQFEDMEWNSYSFHSIIKIFDKLIASFFQVNSICSIISDSTSIWSSSLVQTHSEFSKIIWGSTLEPDRTWNDYEKWQTKKQH